MLHLLLALAQMTRIVYDAPDHPLKVAVVGDFNSWDAPGIRMTPIENGYRWKLDLNLEPGSYRYTCLENGAAPPTGAARDAAVKWLLVTPKGYANHPAALDDGIITESGLGHYPDPRDTWRLSERTIEIGFRTRHDDVRTVSIAVSQPEAEQKDYPMVRAEADPVFDWFTVKIVVNPDKPFLYRFLLDDGAGPRAYDTGGLSGGLIGGGDPFRQDPATMTILKEAPPQVARRHPRFVKATATNG
jgi:hypothetical protein